MTDTHEAVSIEFERYFLESRKSKGTNRKPTFERFEDGTYKDDHTQRHWWTWQNALLCRIPAIETARDVAVELAAKYAAERDQLRAELEQVRVPEGWKLVPVEPTREMWAAVNKLDDEFPDGKLNEDDSGAVAMAVGVENNRVVLRFPKPIAWVGMTGDEAFELGQMLLKHARHAGVTAPLIIRVGG